MPAIPGPVRFIVEGDLSDDNISWDAIPFDIDEITVTARGRTIKGAVTRVRLDCPTFGPSSYRVEGRLYPSPGEAKQC